jgi:protein SCO1/2
LRFIKYILLLLFFTVHVGGLHAQDTVRQEVGLDEHLEQTIPLQLSFLDEYGKAVTLRELFTKPTILTLVYFRCPGICSPLLNGVAEMVEKLDMEPGRDYNIVTVSFNPSEDYLMAGEKKRNYVDNMKKKIPDASWHFLTGDSASIAKLTDAVGFRYKKEGTEFVHSAVITVLSGDGKIARYLYGTNFLPLDVKLALTEASEGKSGPTINKLVKLCFSYDPEARQYVLSITRIAGGASLLAVIGFALFLILKKKRNQTNLPVLNGKGIIQNG